MSVVRCVYLFGSYFEDFYNQRDKRAQEKIARVLRLISQIENVPKKFLKHLGGPEGLFEIRISYGSSAFRVFCFLDSEKKLILLNAFVKKSNKIPRNEIALAIKLKNEYVASKRKMEHPL